MKAAIDPRYATVQQHLDESAAVTRRTAAVCLGSIIEAADLIAEAFRNGGKLLLCGNGGSAADCQHMAAELTSRLTADFVRPGLPAIALTTDTSFLTAYANDFDFDGVFARQVQALGKPGDVLLAISTSGKSKNVVLAAQLAREMGMKVIALTGGGCAEKEEGREGERETDEKSSMEDGGSKMEHGEPAGGHRFEENWSRGMGQLGIEAGKSGQATPPGPPFLRGGEMTDGKGGSLPLVQNQESDRMPLLQVANVGICIPSNNTQHIQEVHLAVEHVICHLVERALFERHQVRAR